MPPTPVSSAPFLSVIIVSFNTRDMTLRCLQSVQKSLETADFASEILVVDNASKDGSADAIRAQFPAVHVLESHENLGFGRANNLAMNAARGQFFLLLNSDAFPIGDAISRLCAFLKSQPQAAAAAPKILNEDGSLQRSVWDFPTPARSWFDNSGVGPLLRKLGFVRDFHAWNHDETREIPWAIGACLLVRREVFETLGGFDERFWMYAEETDWQKVWRDAGWKILFFPDAQITHLGGGSGAGNSAVKAAFFDSYDLYLHKHHGKIGVFGARAAMIFGLLLRLPLWFLMGAARPKNPENRDKLRQSLALLKRHARAPKFGR